MRSKKLLAQTMVAFAVLVMSAAPAFADYWCYQGTCCRMNDKGGVTTNCYFNCSPLLSGQVTDDVAWTGCT
jgi:hypothetical protein